MGRDLWQFLLGWTTIPENIGMLLDQKDVLLPSVGKPYLHWSRVAVECGHQRVRVLGLIEHLEWLLTAPRDLSDFLGC